MGYEEWINKVYTELQKSGLSQTELTVDLSKYFKRGVSWEQTAEMAKSTAKNL